jgi:hypothetical protein
MEVRRNDSTLSIEQEVTDISSTYNSTFHSNDDNNDDNDDDISESLDSMQEEIVVPETDRIQSACPREFGYTKIYEVEQGINGNAGTKIAVSRVSMYFNRGNELEHLNMIEYECLIQTEKKKTENDNIADNLLELNARQRGRQSSPRFEYETQF